MAAAVDRIDQIILIVIITRMEWQRTLTGNAGNGGLKGPEEMQEVN